MGGLVGVQKRAALLRIGGPGDLVVHLRRSPVAMQTATANVAARQARMGAMGRVRGRSKMSPPRFRSGLADHMQKKSPAAVVRSEEHTSELQSLMRISYAVFCLKKKKKKQKHNKTHQNH